MSTASCRFCTAPLEVSFCDLGMSPLANAFLEQAQLQLKERFYPLHAYVCNRCFLVQLPEAEPPERLFSDYAYFSSYSESWLDHARRYTEAITDRFGLGSNSQVIELASNDGYLLQYFKEKGIPVLGIEPAENVAAVARDRGIQTLSRFFDLDVARDLVSDGIQADLLLGNNVLAHVPNINDFVAGMKLLLKADGVITMEFPSLERLIEGNQFDTIYHEHVSYLSYTVAERIFGQHEITLFDVEELPTHGGSLRIFGGHTDGKLEREISSRVGELREHEAAVGLGDPGTYSAFYEQVEKTKRELMAFLIQAKEAGNVIVGYGAPAKGNTLLNYCGIRDDFLEYTVDRSPHKQGLFLPGTHIPVRPPEALRETRPDFVLILPWNLKDEIIRQTAYVREWGGKFVVPIPRVEVIE